MTRDQPFTVQYLKLHKSLEDMPETEKRFYYRLRDLSGRIRLRNRPSTEIMLMWHAQRQSFYFQVHRDRPDSFTGAPGHGTGGKFYVSEHMIDSEIVQGIWGLFKAYEEHETREAFEFDDELIYGPHIDVEALAIAAKHLAVRPS